MQIITLHDFGLLTIWTIIQLQTIASGSNNDIKQNQSYRIDHHSPWSKVKLIESVCIDLHDVLQMQRVRPKSGFERTRSYFESNLFSDTALRELQDNTNRTNSADDDEKNVLYGDVEMIGDTFFVTTNRQFLLTGSKSLNRKSLRKLMLDDGKFLILLLYDFIHFKLALLYYKLFRYVVYILT